MARLSFKVAPGVRISASSRGVRTSIGNSKARVSYGGGRTYTSAKIAGVRVSNTSSSKATGTTGSYARPTLAQLERAEKVAAQDSAIEELRNLEASLVSLHHETFPAASMPVIAPPSPADRDAIQQDLEKSFLREISWFKFAARRAAKVEAAEQAQRDAAQIDSENQTVYRQHCHEAQEDWQNLAEHHADSVIEALETAFADNASEATCIDAGTEDGTKYATVVVVFGSVDSVPERAPSTTPSGKLTTKKRTKTDRNALYVSALGSTVLAAVKEGFAVAPSVEEFRVVVLRKDLSALTPEEFVTPIYMARYSRETTTMLDWRETNPTEALLAAGDARFNRKGVVGNVVPIDVSDQPELLELVQMFSSLVRE